MGVFDIFRRKKEELGSEQPPDFGAGQDFGNPQSNFLPPGDSFRPNFPQDNLQPNFSQSNLFQQPQQGLSDRDMQFIVAKLELLQQKLEVLDRRLQTIEQIAKESQ